MPVPRAGRRGPDRHFPEIATASLKPRNDKISGAVRSLSLRAALRRRGNPYSKTFPFLSETQFIRNIFRNGLPRQISYEILLAMTDLLTSRYASGAFPHTCRTFRAHWKKPANPCKSRDAHSHTYLLISFYIFFCLTQSIFLSFSWDNICDRL